MAAIEKVTINQNLVTDHSRKEGEGHAPGLRILSRSTSASLPDYGDWTMEELMTTRRDAVITDGACS